MPKTQCKMLKVYIHSRFNNKKWNPDGITGFISKSIEGKKGENNSDLEESLRKSLCLYVMLSVLCVGPFTTS